MQIFAENNRFSQIHPFSWKIKDLEGGGNRRKPHIFAENRRLSQIGLCHLRFVTSSSALKLIGSQPLHQVVPWGLVEQSDSAQNIVNWQGKSSKIILTVLIVSYDVSLGTQQIQVNLVPVHICTTLSVDWLSLRQSVGLDFLHSDAGHKRLGPREKNSSDYKSDNSAVAGLCLLRMCQLQLLFWQMFCMHSSKRVVHQTFLWKGFTRSRRVVLLWQTRA